MIVVIVAEKHRIDARKIVPPHTRLAAAARTNGRKRTCPNRPDGIRQDMDLPLLQEPSGMIDQRNPQLSAFHGGWRF